MENNRLDYNDFAPLFGKWAILFKPFIESEEMYKIYQRLKKDARMEKILPNSDNVFKAFQTTDPHNVKVIWYLMDPYARTYGGNIPQATGIGLDCSNTPDGKLLLPLTKFYDAIDKDLDLKVERNPSLQYLHDQGCMMLNSDLTVKYNKVGSHEGLWEPFQKFFLEEIMGKQTHIIYVLCGKPSKKMRRYIYDLGNHIFELEHPNVATYGKNEWDSKNIFNKINRLLNEHYNKGYEIEWDKKQHDYLPF